MGTHCCSQQFDSYELKLDKIQTSHKSLRMGYPSEKVAIKMSQIGQRIHDQTQLNSINTMMFKIKQYESKFKQPFKVNKQPILQNRLEDPYYLPSLGMFYVGQWIFDGTLRDNVPGGIGRLYEQGAISEGCFKSVVLTEEQIRELKEVQEEQKNWLKDKRKSIVEDSQSEFSHTAEKQRKFSTLTQNFKHTASTGIFSDKDVFKLISNNYVSLAEPFYFVVKLHGHGRIVQKQYKSTQQIQMQGEFNKGVLNGKGTLKILDGGVENYSYVGSWKNGDKHGKGIQKTAGYRYDGNFQLNQKRGKGVQYFIASAREEHQIQRDVQRLQRKMINESQRLKNQATKKVQVRKYKQKLIQQQLSKKQYPSSKIILNVDRSLIFDMNFILQRTYRTIFPENYNGDFKNGKMQGFGTYVWGNGKIYRGEWKSNKMNGKGEFYWPDGSYYQGSYENDERNGEGIMVWSVSRRYRGNWAFGMRHGYGQSIQVDEGKMKMTVKGSIWDRDKPKKSLFEETFQVTGYNQLEIFYRNLQRILEDPQPEPLKKQKSLRDLLLAKALKEGKQPADPEDDKK